MTESLAATTTPQTLHSTSYADTHSTAANAVIAIVLFLLAGVAEIGGGWLVWQTLREHRAWYFAFTGAFVLFLYGVIPTLQPLDNFGRVYAVYGGFFVLLSYLWGWVVDGVRPDLVDWITCAVVMTAVMMAYFYPR